MVDHRDGYQWLVEWRYWIQENSFFHWRFEYDLNIFRPYGSSLTRYEITTGETFVVDLPANLAVICAG